MDDRRKTLLEIKSTLQQFDRLEEWALSRPYSTRVVYQTKVGGHDTKLLAAATEDPLRARFIAACDPAAMAWIVDLAMASLEAEDLPAAT